MLKANKIQDLAGLLARGKRGVSRKDLQARWTCSPATVHRIVTRARDELGMPITFDTKTGRYRCDSEKALEAPGLWFHPDELASLFGLSHWLDSLGSGVLAEKLIPIQKRLEGMLAQQDLTASDWKERIRLLPMAARKIDPDLLLAASQAVLRRRTAAFEYQGVQDRGYSRREVSPQSLVRYRDNWFLDAYCHASRALRSFSISRMRHFQSQAKLARDLPRQELTGHFADAYGIFAGKAKSKAVLVFEGLAARLVEQEQWHPKQVVRYLPEGRIRMEFPCGDIRELARDVMRYADEVTVEGPEELRMRCQAMVRRAGERLGRAGKNGK